jgi:hypothetical protein
MKEAGQMISQRKIEANRRNARRSTGPRTPEGKARSRMNALRHTLRGSLPQLLEEDSEAFLCHRRSLLRQWRPRDELERALVETLARMSWRLDRMGVIEAALLNRCYSAAWKTQFGQRPPPGADMSLLDRALLGEEMGKWFSGVNGPFERLRLYEQSAERRFYSALHELEGLRRGPVPAPGAETSGLCSSSPAKAAGEGARTKNSGRTNPPVPQGGVLAQPPVNTGVIAGQAAVVHAPSAPENEPTAAHGPGGGQHGGRLPPHCNEGWSSSSTLRAGNSRERPVAPLKGLLPSQESQSQTIMIAGISPCESAAAYLALPDTPAGLSGRRADRRGKEGTHGNQDGRGHRREG